MNKSPNAKGDVTLAAVAAAQAVNKARGIANELPTVGEVDTSKVAKRLNDRFAASFAGNAAKVEGDIAKLNRAKAAVAVGKVIDETQRNIGQAAETMAQGLVAAAVSKGYPAGVVKRPNQYYIDPTTIRVREGWNPRIDFGEIELLAASIKSELEKDPASGGLINDIRVVRLAKPTADGGIFEIVDGGRRFLAIQQLMKKGVKFPDGVPAKLESRDSSDLDKLIRMFTANTGKAFLPLEQADAFKRMRDAGMTLKQIENATGCSDNTIVGALALLDADQSVQDAVKSGKLSGGVAKSIAVNARGDKAKQAELAKAAVAAGKDKKAKKAVLLAIDDERRKKAKAQGKRLKMRALTDDQLSAIGKKMADLLVERMAAIDLAPDTSLTTWLKDGDGDIRVAFAFGVLEGLKAAAGMPVDLVGE